MMMENNEIQVLHRINKRMAMLIADFNSIVNDLSELTQMIYDREIEILNEDREFKLRSHM